MFLSHINVSISLCLPFSLKSINASSGENLKKKEVASIYLYTLSSYSVQGILHTSLHVFLT